MSLPAKPETELVEQLLSASAEALMLVDEAGLIRYCNPTTERLFGFGPQELIGQRVEVLVPRRFHRMHARRRDHFVSGDYGQSHSVARPMLHGVRKEGEEFPVAINLTRIPRHGAVWTAVAVRDVTPGTRVEQRNRSILEALPVALIGIDQRGVITTTNSAAAQLCGYSDGELDGKVFDVLVPDRHRDHLRALFHGIFRGGSEPDAEAASGPAVAVRADGVEIPVQTSISVLDTQDGPWALCLFWDRTETDAAVRDVAQLRDQVIGAVSHELRTPLASIVGYTELLCEMEEEVGPVAHAMLRKVEHNAVRELRLVDDLLNLVSLTGRSVTMRREVINLTEVVGRAVEETYVRSEVGERTLTFVPEDVDPVWVDPHRIGQVIDNLLSNAVKFTEPEGTIRVTVRDSGSVAVLEVSDDGSGFDANEQQRVFDRLFRGQAAIREQKPGAGLGLAIVREIVEAHDGWVDAHSEPGEGTTMRVLLPYAETDSQVGPGQRGLY